MNSILLMQRDTCSYLENKFYLQHSFDQYSDQLSLHFRKFTLQNYCQCFSIPHPFNYGKLGVQWRLFWYWTISKIELIYTTCYKILRIDQYQTYPPPKLKLLILLFQSDLDFSILWIKKNHAPIKFQQMIDLYKFMLIS